MNNLAGGRPEELRRMLVHAIEFCHILYLPVYMKGQGYKIPRRVKEYKDLVYSVPLTHDYMYLTVRHQMVTKGAYSNRPGWHVDGYLSDDENYIWSSSEPTEWMDQEVFRGAEDHEEALKQFEKLSGNVIEMNSKVLYKLGKTIHRTPLIKQDGIRLFVKISCSNEIYNLKGNAINELFDYNWKYKDRLSIRNHQGEKI